MKETKQTTCRVCGTTYAATFARCPRCGCERGGTKPAFLRCKRCGTVMPSSRHTCPGCGLDVSPHTATGVLLPPGWAAEGRRQRRRLVVGAVVLVVLLIVEAFVVRAVFSHVTYSESLHLWNSGGSIEANRRAPDPVYQEVDSDISADTVATTPPPAAVDTTAEHIADSILTAE